MSQRILSHSIKREVKDTLSLSIPLITSQLVYASSSFIGTALVAQLGEDALAASVLVSTIWMSLTVLFFGILNSVSVLVSHQYGARNYHAISKIMGQSFLLGIAITVIMGLLLISMPLFLRLTTQPPEVIRLSLDYMWALLWTIPGLIILIIYEQFLAGISKTKFVLLISLLVVPVEIPLIYLLIFGKFGLPACGVAGIGYGFAITYSVTTVLLTLYLVKAKYYRQFAIFSAMRELHADWLKELIFVGLPMGFMHVIEVSTFTIITFWIARYGTTMLAAHQIVLQYLGFAITLVFAMSQAVTIRVGQAVGRLDLSGIRLAIYIGMLLSFACVLIVAIALYLFPLFFLRLDVDVNDAANAALIKDASSLLMIGGVLLLFDNFRIIGFGALRGLKDTKFPMYASFIAFWVIGLSAAYLFTTVFHLEGRGIWWGLTAGIGFGAVIVFIRLQSLLKKTDIAHLNEIGKIKRK